MSQLLHAESMNETEGDFDLDIGVIYTYEREFMTPLIDSLIRSGEGLRMRLIFVDNASDDGVEEWANNCEHVHVLRNSARLGYAANLNRILQASTGRYVLLLNTDMFFDLEEQCLTKMVEFLDRDSETGLAGCRLYHPDGTYGFPARRFPQLTTVIARRFAKLFRAPRTIGKYLYEENSREATFNCDWLSGCFLMVRRSCLLEVGLFDQGFRKYFEDVDYCGRVARSGWQVKFFGGTFCYHWEQRDSARLFSRDSWIHVSSYARWLVKRLFRCYARGNSNDSIEEVAATDLANARKSGSAPVSGPHGRQESKRKNRMPNSKA